MDVVGALLVGMAGLSGAVGWNGSFACLPLGVGVLVCWRASRSRTEALGIALAYYGSASFDLIEAASTFFGSRTWGSGVLVWAFASLLLSVPWAALWSPTLRTHTGQRVIRGTVLLLVTLVPPLGLIGWTNPWVAGVSVFPGLRYWAFALVTVACLAPDRRTWPAWAATSSLVSALACGSYVPVDTPNWKGLPTRFSTFEGPLFTQQYNRAVDMWGRAANVNADLVLFPEGVGGAWTPSGASLWELEAQESHTVMIVGAIYENRSGRRNGVGVVGEGDPYFWSQRWPAPIGMWAPWRPRVHAQSRLFGSSIRVIQGRRTALLVCFEQFVVWPAFQSALEGAEVVLAPANLRFAGNTNFNAVREVTLQSWAALMGWSVVEAVNE